ncbi:MAG: hypothetical protein PHU40_10280 [Sulfurimonas sp.]|nr:hypothetical protein [Sulfurimonas sp.]
MDSVYLGRQPIIDGDSNLYAYEILYRDQEKKSNVGTDRFATASVVSSVLNKGTSKNTF